MPIYGYRCESCGNEFEILQKMSDPALKTCPKCSGALRKMVYAAGVIYKGSGYYSTDYNKGGSKRVAEKSADGAAKGSDKSEGNGAAASADSVAESKPAAEAKAESSAPKSDSSSTSTTSTEKSS